MPLTAEQILAANRATVTSRLLKVHVPEWQCDIYVKALNIGELQTWEIECLRAQGKGIDEFRSKWLSMCLVDEHGTRLFPDHEKVKEFDSVVGARLWKLCREHNETGDQVVEEIGKN